METIAQQNYDLFINGQCRSSAQGRYFPSINPSTGEVWAYAADAQMDDLQAAVSSAREAFDQDGWSSLGIRERGQYLHNIARLIREDAKRLAELECLDTGKTIKQTTFIDVPTAADTFEYFGSVGEQLKGSINPVPAPVKSFTEREPMGVVGCIIPFNYPLIMAAWKMAPALIAGNTVILKPSPLASVSVMRLAQLMQEAGLPSGVVNIISSQGHELSAELVKSPQVDMISFTGSTQTGKTVMHLAAETAKKIILELGGKSPTIVFSDCDLETAVGGTMSAIFMNQGQMCTAGARLLLEDKIYDRFLEMLVEKTKKLTIGPAMSYATDFGPVISQEHRDHILAWIQNGATQGARLVCGGKIPVGEDFKNGFYIAPTILDNVDPKIEIVREEIFGPVLCVMKFFDYKEAITLANDSSYGLAASVWTKDLVKAHVIAKKLRCGTVWINTYGGFYNEASFGGCRQSGFGRELGREGLWEYMVTKHVCIDMTPGGRPLVANWF